MILLILISVCDFRPLRRGSIRRLESVRLSSASGAPLLHTQPVLLLLRPFSFYAHLHHPMIVSASASVSSCFCNAFNIPFPSLTVLLSFVNRKEGWRPSV